MRILVMLGLLAAPLLASSDDKTSTREESREAAQAAKEDVKDAGQDAKAKTQEAGREVKQDAHRMGDAADRRVTTGDEMKQDNKASREASMGRDAKKEHPFADADNFEVKGKLQKVSKNSITIRRDEDKLPPAKLNVDKMTKIEIEGEKATWSKLQQGADVQASFNLRNDQPVAVEIKAEKTDVQKQREDRMKEQREQQMERQPQQPRQ